MQLNTVAISSFGGCEGVHYSVTMMLLIMRFHNPEH